MSSEAAAVQQVEMVLKQLGESEAHEAKGSTTWRRGHMAEIGMEPAITRLTRDLKEASCTLSSAEARYLVDAYYTMQGDRIRTDAQIRAQAQSGEPHSVLAWVAANSATLEGQIKRALDAYSDAHRVGRWSKSIVGIGPVIAAGLLAHIDITKAPTVGHIWRFAGLDPTVRWQGAEDCQKWLRAQLDGADLNDAFTYRAAREWGRRPESLLRLATTDLKTGEVVPLTLLRLARALARRPWNASLKTLTWKIGESFVKVSGHERDVYGKLYLERKVEEQAQNEAGAYADQAAAMLRAKRFRDDTGAKRAYEAGRLPPGHIHARAKRWVVKLFLSHWHYVAHVDRFGVPPPKPYILTVAGGHAHEIPTPNWPMD